MTHLLFFLGRGSIPGWYGVSGAGSSSSVLELLLAVKH